MIYSDSTSNEDKVYLVIVAFIMCVGALLMSAIMFQSHKPLAKKDKHGELTKGRLQILGLRRKSRHGKEPS